MYLTLFTNKTLILSYIIIMFHVSLFSYPLSLPHGLRGGIPGITDVNWYASYLLSACPRLGCIMYLEPTSHSMDASNINEHGSIIPHIIMELIRLKHGYLIHFCCPKYGVSMFIYCVSIALHCSKDFNVKIPHLSW